MNMRMSSVIFVLILISAKHAEGDVLYTFVSPNEEEQGGFGVSVSAAGDVNNDGYPDIIVGAYCEDPGSSPTSAGRAYVFSGMNGLLLEVVY